MKQNQQVSKRKLIIMLAIASIPSILFLSLALWPNTADAQYLTAEIYPQGPLFIAGGVSQDNGLKVDAWTNVGSEIGTTIGAKFTNPLNIQQIDYLKIGFGPSIMTVVNETMPAGEEIATQQETQDLGYFNFDIALGATIGKFQWNSYTMWQMSQHDSIDDFWFSRNTVAYGDASYGFFGHWKKSGDNPFEPFCGIYYDLGHTGPVASSQLVFTFNLDPQDKADGTPADDYWTAWIINF